MSIELDPEEEYAIIPVDVLRRLLSYATVVCQEHCPVGRDPATCPYIVKLTRSFGLGKPPCTDIYGEYRKDTFRVLIRDLERKYRIGIEDFVRRAAKPRSLEEEEDYMEATFYLGVLKELDNLKGIYIAKGSDISVRRASVIK